MSSIQFTVIQQKTGQGKKTQTLAPEQEGILRAEMFLDGPELHGSNGTLLPWLLHGCCGSPDNTEQDLDLMKEQLEEEEKKQSWTAVQLSKLNTEVLFGLEDQTEDWCHW